MTSKVPWPKNTAGRVVFPIFDNDGDLVGGAAALDSEKSVDGGVFSDCTNEATNITSGGVNSGLYYLDLVAAETNGDVFCIQVKTSTADAKTTVLIFYTALQTLDVTDALVDGVTAKLPTNYLMGSTVVTAKDTTIDAVKVKTDQLIFTGAYVNSQVKATDNVDLSANQKLSVNAEMDVALNTVLPASPTADSVNDRIKKIHQIGKNTCELVGNQMKVYADDDVTVLYTFNLTDSTGAPAMEKVYKRTKA